MTFAVYVSNSVSVGVNQDGSMDMGMIVPPVVAAVALVVAAAVAELVFLAVALAG